MVENCRSPLTRGIAFTTVYALMCYTVIYCEMFLLACCIEISSQLLLCCLAVVVLGVALFTITMYEWHSTLSAQYQHTSRKSAA